MWGPHEHASKSKVAEAELRVLAKQVELYMMDNTLSVLPEDFTLASLLSGDGTYLRNKNDIVDPWNTMYVVIVPGVHNNDFDVMTYGADGAPGGEGEDMDVVNK